MKTALDLHRYFWGGHNIDEQKTIRTHMENINEKNFTQKEDFKT